MGSEMCIRDRNMWKRSDLEAEWLRTEPLSGLLRVERLLGRQPLPDRVCAVCSSHTRTKCSVCMQTYYCSSTCQRAHWSQHRDSCRVPLLTTERHLAIAVPEYRCFWAYKDWLSTQSTSENDLGFCIMNRDDFKATFGSASMLRTCLTLAFTGRPACLVIAVFD